MSVGPAASPEPPQPAAPTDDEVLKLAEALELRRVLNIIKSVYAMKDEGATTNPYCAGFSLACEEIFYRATDEQWHLDEDDSRFPRLAASPVAQPAAPTEPVTVEAVATTRRDKDGELFLDWLIEGGISALECEGVVLLIANRPITDDEGSGQVYAAVSPVEPPPPEAPQEIDGIGLQLTFPDDAFDAYFDRASKALAEKHPALLVRKLASKILRMYAGEPPQAPAPDVAS